MAGRGKRDGDQHLRDLRNNAYNELRAVIGHFPWWYQDRLNEQLVFVLNHMVQRVRAFDYRAWEIPEDLFTTLFMDAEKYRGLYEMVGERADKNLSEREDAPAPSLDDLTPRARRRAETETASAPPARERTPEPATQSEVQKPTTSARRSRTQNVQPY